MRTVSADRKSTRLNSSHVKISYAVFCLKKKNQLARLRGPAMARPDLLKHISRDAAGRALPFQALEHLGFSPKEHLEPLAQFFVFHYTPTTQIHTLSLHDALPI